MSLMSVSVVRVALVTPAGSEFDWCLVGLTLDKA